MFCRQCHANSTTSFHRFECPIMDHVLGESTFSSSMLMAIRTFFVALSLFDGSVDSMEKFLSENCESRSVFDSDGSVDMKQRLLTVNSLVSNDKIEVNEAFLEELLFLSPELKSVTSSNRNFVKKFLTQQTQIAILNYHEICDWSLKKGGLQDDEISDFKESLAYKRGVLAQGNGSYPFGSLLNHSCSPQVARKYIDSKAILIVVKPVGKGEQLFDNYGYNFTNFTKDHRRNELFKQYKFMCKCVACQKDWPLFPSLQVLDKTLFNKAKKVSRELSLVGFNQKKVIDKFKEIAEILEKGRTNYPSLEKTSLEQSFTALIEIISKPIIEFP